MHKNLSGKTEFVSHTRNSALGKRGTNKRERKVPLPNEDEPASKPRKKPKKKVPHPYHVEFQLYGGQWMLWGSYKTEAERDLALAKYGRSIFGSLRFRSVDDKPKKE